MADSRAGATCSMSEPLGCSVHVLDVLQWPPGSSTAILGDGNSTVIPSSLSSCVREAEGTALHVLPPSWTSLVFSRSLMPFLFLCAILRKTSRLSFGFVLPVGQKDLWQMSETPSKSDWIQPQLQEHTACQDKECLLRARVPLWWWQRSGRLWVVGLHLPCAPPETAGK